MQGFLLFRWCLWIRDVIHLCIPNLMIEIFLIIFDYPISARTRPTVCVTCWWAGVDKTHYTEKCSGAESCLKTRRVPPVKCTLCWAVTYHATSLFVLDACHFSIVLNASGVPISCKASIARSEIFRSRYVLKSQNVPPQSCRFKTLASFKQVSSMGIALGDPILPNA